MKQTHRSFAHGRRPARRQRGATLIEGMVALTIFSFGILALVGMLATHSSTANDARYRVEAAQYAESIIAEMRLVPADTMQAQFSAGGANYQAWSDRLKAPGALPMADVSAERLTITFTAARTPTITIRWRAPADRSSVPHQYVTSTFI